MSGSIASTLRSGTVLQAALVTTALLQKRIPGYPPASSRLSTAHWP